MGAHLEGADLSGAYLKGADLKGAHLEGVENLSIEQLSEVKTLYEVELDESLHTLVKERDLTLFEKPD